MSAIRWTGAGFDHAGEIMTAEHFEAWLSAEGNKRVEQTLGETPLNWLWGKTRATSHLRKEAYLSANRRPAFRAALVNELNTLPGIVTSMATEAHQNAPTIMFCEKILNYVIAVPRVVVRKRFSASLVSHLADAAELRNFPGLAATLLERQASEAENEFFNKMENANPGMAVEADKLVIMGTDPRYEWGDASHPGHYYVARQYVGTPNLDSEDGRAGFQDKFGAMHGELSRQIGAMDTSQHNAVLQFFKLA
jgi:hypothetical protein